MLENTKHYVEEVFEVCGYEWTGEEYILPDYVKNKLLNTKKIVVGINTGAGQLWRTRIPHTQKLEEIISAIHNDFEIVLLGGPDEHQRNLLLKEKYNLRYFGINSYEAFINVIDNCDIVITPVTMALHIAIGLGKQVILLNNIFNKHEFHLYGKGTIIEPQLKCLGCYKKEFDEECPVNDCTLYYDIDNIINSLQNLSNEIKKH